MWFQEWLEVLQQATWLVEWWGHQWEWEWGGVEDGAVDMDGAAGALAVGDLGAAVAVLEALEVLINTEAAF